MPKRETQIAKRVVQESVYITACFSLGFTFMHRSKHQFRFAQGTSSLRNIKTRQKGVYQNYALGNGEVLQRAMTLSNLVTQPVSLFTSQSNAIRQLFYLHICLL